MPYISLYLIELCIYTVWMLTVTRHDRIEKGASNNIISFLTANWRTLISLFLRRTHVADTEKNQAIIRKWNSCAPALGYIMIEAMAAILITPLILSAILI